jgi:4-hydroxy-tetrahydrodipicolinate reductase
MVRVGIAGAAGRMGQRLVAAVRESADVALAAALEVPGHPGAGQDAGSLAGCGPMGVALSTDPEAALAAVDVLIDFSHHQASMGHLRRASAMGKPMVIGTTGFTGEEREEMGRLARFVPCVASPNMSVGVNVLLRVLGEVAAALGSEYDVEIVEAHHRRKADAPSGTALRMAEVVAASLGRDLQDVGVFSRHGQIGPRTDREIGIQTVRGGDIVGEHTVIFAGMGERVEITHRAHSRDNFARGAVRAALWVVGQGPGLYDMQDVLGVRR